MSSIANRAGIPVTPDITTAGTPGVSAELRTFAKRYVRPCVVTNTEALGGDTLYVHVNGMTASDSDFLCACLPLEAVDVSFEGRLNITTISLFYATADYSKAKVHGWLS